MMHRDLRESGVDAANHYLNFGILEGRPYKPSIPHGFDWKYYAERRNVNFEGQKEAFVDWFSLGRQLGIPFREARKLQIRKWYFAVSESSLGRNMHDWQTLILAAVTSCLVRTDLKPTLIYDGKRTSFIDLLESLGVTIIFHRVSIYPELARASLRRPGYLPIASGAFLRIDIPEIETSDEFVLYTDCDVVFRRQPSFSFSPPALFAAAPETNKSNYEEDMNSGVLVLNVPEMKKSLPAFRESIVANLENGWPGADQAHFRHFYRGLWGHLPLRMNWKPYWTNPSDGVEIEHWHGPKPLAYLRQSLHPSKEFPAIWRSLLEKNPSGYADSIEHFLQVLQVTPLLLSQKVSQVRMGYCFVAGQEITSEQFRAQLSELNAIVKQSGAPMEGNLYYHHRSEPENQRMPDPSRLAKRGNFSTAVIGCRRLLEIGFNAGHSAHLALHSDSLLEVVSVDICSNPYTLPAAAYLKSQFPNRFNFIKGDSSTVLQDLALREEKFDIFHVDGGHGVNQAITDIENCIRLSSAKAKIIVDDTNSSLIQEAALNFVKSGLLVVDEDSIFWQGNENMLFRVK